MCFQLGETFFALLEAQGLLTTAAGNPWIFSKDRDVPSSLFMGMKSRVKNYLIKVG